MFAARNTSVFLSYIGGQSEPACAIGLEQASFPHEFAVLVSCSGNKFLCKLIVAFTQLTITTFWGCS